MAEIDAGAIRARRFSVARKGYDRSEVEAYLDELAGAVERVHDRLAGLEAQFEQLGIQEPTDLAAELETIGDEVAAVLGQARAAAEAMRRRASEDAERWRSEVDEELRRVRTEAEEQAEALRRSAWEAGTELVEHAVATRDATLAAAEQDAMALRTDAEQEAARLTNEARRIREEASRDAREDAERTLTAARGEAAAIVAAATREAEAAQYRAQALEARRVELLAELEAAQIEKVDREGVAEAPGERTGEEGDTDRGPGLGVVEVPPPDVIESDGVTHGTHPSRWAPDEVGSVRIVSASRVIRAGAVDADALAAEVQALHEQERASQPHEQIPEAIGRDPEPVADLEPVAEPEATHGSASELTAQPRAQAEATSEVEPGEAPEVAPEPAIEVVPRSAPETEADVEPPPAPETEETSAGGPEAIDGLFASLRSPAPPPSSAPDRGNGSDLVASTASESAIPVAIHDVDPFAVRDQALLPIQNRTLRNVKRQLVDLQNQALGALRADEHWAAGEDFFASAIRADLSVLARESTGAGVAAASELTGVESTSTSGDVTPVDPTGDFVAALGEAVDSALARSRRADAGSRETAATVSRVFRAWRTDEAERRVRTVSLAAYHRGLVEASLAIGVSRFVVESAGHACSECAAGRGSWELSNGPPTGTSMPPARVDCTCALIPVG